MTVPEERTESPLGTSRSVPDRSSEELQARIATLSRLAAGMRVDQPLAVTLAEVVDAVRRTTSAVACSVVCWGEDPDVPATAFADETLGPHAARALEEFWSTRALRQVAVEDYPPVVRRGFRAQALADPAYRSVHRVLAASAEWEDVAFFPLAVSGVVHGELAVHLVAGQVLSEDERAYLATLADQAAVAVRNSILFRSAEQNATLVERHRLARELHDSVSQALFSMTLHARTAQRHLQAADLPAEHPVAVELAQLHALSQAALAEMRALIFELRPGALAAEGLVPALTRQAAALSAREQVPVGVHGPAERLPLPPRTEEQLYRLVLEALHNAIKHARASELTVDVAVAEGVVEIVVADDGCGFDPSAVRSGHLGMETMRDRADAVGGELRVDSAPGAGTRVRVRVPIA